MATSKPSPLTSHLSSIGCTGGSKGRSQHGDIGGGANMAGLGGTMALQQFYPPRLFQAYYLDFSTHVLRDQKQVPLSFQ